MSRLLVTGFGPFPGVRNNPSAELARRLGVEHRILPVEYSSVDPILQEIGADCDTLLMLGVSVRASTMKMELFAANAIGSKADASGLPQTPRLISRDGPPRLETTLWAQSLWPTPGDTRITLSADAGTYLCNYLYYRALSRLPRHRIGFLHVARPQVLSLEEQLRVLQGLIAGLPDGAAGQSPCG